MVVALTPRPELGGAVGATTNLRTLERWNGEKMASVNELDFYFCKLTPQSAIWRSRAIVNLDGPMGSLVDGKGFSSVVEKPTFSSRS